MSKFNQRVFGCAIVRAINANYNADFSSQPRTLPNGTCYATDKALKYLVRNYLKNTNADVLYFKRLNTDFNPLDLPDTYKQVFKKEVKDESKQNIAQSLLSQIDVRLFGATFAPKGAGIKDKNISIHGPVQFNHGINIWKENNIFSEQIMSPFSSPNERKDGEEQAATTLGRQSKLQEGHYLHHLSVNPKNIDEIVKLAGANATPLSKTDMDSLKEALRLGATYFDSSAKAGIDNEALVWITLKEGAKSVLPTFNNLIKLDKSADKVVLNLADLTTAIERLGEDVESIELYYLVESVNVINEPKAAKHFDISSGKAINKS
jgi:CRISPR-associated protein Csh2